MMLTGWWQETERYAASILSLIHIYGVSYDVDVDFLSGKYGGDGGNVSKHVDGINTLPATGGNFAFDFSPTDVKIEYMREDGAKDSGHVKVISVDGYKRQALKQLKVKDKRIVSILSGGNMDVITMSSVVLQGLILRDRIFTVSVLLPDKPGELCRVCLLYTSRCV